MIVVSTDFTVAYVQVNGQTGYMQMSDLTAAKPAATVIDAPSENTTLYVTTAGGEQLILRRNASKDSPVEGRYENGTAVTVHSRYNGWAQVTMADGKEGYMLLSHLSASKDGSAAASDSETTNGVTRYTNAETIVYATTMMHVQDGILPAGTQVTAYPVEGDWSTWCYVTAGDLTDYVLSKYLTAKGGSSGKDYTQANTQRVVQIGNPQRLHLRKKASTTADSLGLYANGTVVNVQWTERRNGTEWAYVQAGDKQGYMMTKFLAPSAVTTTETPREEQTTAAPAAAAGTVMVVRTSNTGRLHLREKANSSAKSLGLYQNGTAVQVIGELGTWVQVQVGGKTGFMKKRFLAAASENSPEQAAETVKSADADKPAESPQPAETAAAGAVMYVKTGNAGKLHLRAEGTSNAKSLGLYKNGTAVTVLSVSGTWAQVQVNGKAGYMKLRFLAERP